MVIEKKMSLEKRELSAKIQLLTKLSDRATEICQFIKDIKQVADSTGISEEFLKTWLIGEVKQVFEITLPEDSTEVVGDDSDVVADETDDLDDPQ